MKKTVFMVAVMAAVMAVTALEVSAQSELSSKEKKELAKDMKKQKKELYKKSPKMAVKTAKQWKKEGWKSMSLPIEKQLERTWEREALYDETGYPKYVSVQVEALATNYSAAQMQAENVAKVRIASDLCATVASLADVALANNETTPELTASISKAVENSKIVVSNKLGRVFAGTTVYKQDGNKVLVRMIVLYDQKQAVQIAHETVLDELGDESDANRKQLESLMGLDRIQQAYNAR